MHTLAAGKKKRNAQPTKPTAMITRYAIFYMKYSMKSVTVVLDGCRTTEERKKKRVGDHAEGKYVHSGDFSAEGATPLSKGELAQLVNLVEVNSLQLGRFVWTHEWGNESNRFEKASRRSVLSGPRPSFWSRCNAILIFVICRSRSAGENLLNLTFSSCTIGCRPSQRRSAGRWPYFSFFRPCL
jgi:hypothetical protein